MNFGQNCYFVILPSDGARSTTRMGCQPQVLFPSLSHSWPSRILLLRHGPQFCGDGLGTIVLDAECICSRPLRQVEALARSPCLYRILELKGIFKVTTYTFLYQYSGLESRCGCFFWSCIVLGATACTIAASSTLSMLITGATRRLLLAITRCYWMSICRMSCLLWGRVSMAKWADVFGLIAW